MMKPVVSACAFSLVVMAAPAAAQDGRFQTGNLSWTPVITLRDAGVDTNVFDEATDAKRDHIAIVSPEVSGILELGSGSLTMAGAADFVYFRRYTDQRSINGKASARYELPLSRVRPFAGFTFQDARDRQNPEIDLRAHHRDRLLFAGLGFSLTSRADIEVEARRADARYDEGESFRDVELATRFNRDSTGAAARLRYAVTPLTTFTVEGDLWRDEFVLAPQFDTDNLRATAGFTFSPDAVLKGKALIGYHSMKPRGDAAFGFDGLITGIEMGYVLLGRTRLDARILRDTNYSIEAQPFYVQTTYGGEVLHNLFGPVDIIGRASREVLDYDDLPEQAILAQKLYVHRYGGAVAIRAADRMRLTLNYEFAERRAPSHQERQYDRTRVYTTVSYGF